MGPGDSVAAVADQLARRVEQRSRDEDGAGAAGGTSAQAREGVECRVERDLLDEICDAMNQRGSMHARLCGEVYERRLAADRSSRRAGGSYYTPEHLVDFVVSHTVSLARRSMARVPGPEVTGPEVTGPAASTSGQNLARTLMRIIDPACGGGAFLLGALDDLATRYPDRRAAILCGQLHGIDIDPVAVAVCRLALALGAVALPGSIAGHEAPIMADVLDTVIDHVRCADALLERPFSAHFDAVIGNPPWGQKGFRFDRATRARLAARYTTATGVLDPFKLFVERAHQLVRPGGCWGLVLPDIILLKNQQPVRDVILTRSELLWIVDAGRAFPGVNLDAVILVGRCAEPREPMSESAADHRVAIWHGLPPDWRRSAPTTRFLPQRVFLELDGHKLNIHLRPESLALLRQLASSPRLGEFFEVHEGVHSGNVRRKLFRLEPAGERCVPLIVGRREITRYQLRWAGTFLDRDPGLIDRGAGEYANLGRLEWHSGTKIVVRRTGDRIIAALDRRGYHVSNNLFVVLPRDTMDLTELRAHVALLNSRFTTWYFRTVQPRTGRLFAELKIVHLVAFPRPSEAAWRPIVPDLARCAETIERALEADPAAVVARMEAEIDELIAGAFDLDPAQRQLLASS